MRKFILFLTVFFLALFLFDSPAHACKSKPRIDQAYVEGGILHIYGSHFSKHLRLELCGEKLSLEGGERTHNYIQVEVPEELQNWGTCSLVLSKRYKRWRRWRSKKTQTQVIIPGMEPQVKAGNPEPQQPPVELGDTTPPEILNPMGPTYDPGFSEIHVLISLEVKDDTEVAFVGIQNLTSGASRTFYAPPGMTDWNVSEEIGTTPGDNTIMLLASDTHGNIVKDASIKFRRETSCPFCNLQGLNLSGGDFHGAKMPGAFLIDTNLSRANLGNADLSGEAILTRTNLSNANLSNADLSWARFESSNLSGANLTGATLDNVFWKNTICPDGANSDDVGSTCVNNLTP